jgi:hypothetical protein
VEILGVLIMMVLLLIPGLNKLLESVAYRNRAQGKAEVIRARRSAELPPARRKQERRKTRG